MSQLKDDFNIFAGKNIQRVEALSDGIFAIAMTILVLELSIPILGTIHTEGDLWLLVLSIAPKLLVYFMSFITLGLFWIGQTAQYTYIERSDRHLNWLTILSLMFVTLLPFSAALLGEYITFKLAIGIYWLNILLIGLILFIHWQYAYKNGFINQTTETKKVYRALRDRIIIAQILYAVAALLCFISTYLSIVIIIAIQLNFAFAPSFRLKSK